MTFVVEGSLEIILREDISLSDSSKMKFILDSIAVKLLPKKYTPIIIDEREERLTESGDGDSDDGVNYSDKEVKNPFSSEEFFWVEKKLKCLHSQYHIAKLASFQSAQGKYFFSSLINLG